MNMPVAEPGSLRELIERDRRESHLKAARDRSSWARDQERHSARKEGKMAFNQFFPEGGPEDRMAAELLLDGGEMRFSTGVAMAEQAKQFHFLALRQQVLDRRFIELNPVRYDQAATAMGFPYKGPTIPYMFDVWLPQVGPDADYEKLIMAVTVIGETIFSEQIVKFKPGVIINDRPADTIVKGGRSTEIFMLVCLYIAGRFFERWFEEDPAVAAGYLGIVGGSCPAFVNDKRVWIRTWRISPAPFYKYLQLLVGDNNHHLRNPVPTKYLLLQQYSLEHSLRMRVVLEGTGREMMHIPKSILDAYAISSEDFPDLRILP